MSPKITTRWETCLMCNHSYLPLTQVAPILPYIRQADFAVRKPWRSAPARRLLDYLLKYVQAGVCVARVSGVDYVLRPGDFCLVQPDEPFTLESPTDTITPYAHLDIFYHPLREQSFVTLPGQDDLTDYRHLLQPRLNDLPDLAIPVKFTPSDPVRYRDTFLKMIGVWQAPDALSHLEAQHLATELVLTLLREHSACPAPGASDNQEAERGDAASPYR